MKRSYIIFIFFLILLIFANCTKESTIGYPSLPEIVFNYSNQGLPVHIQKYIDGSTGNFNINNPISDNGATLGRVLFYDKNLSINNLISCASCHKQENGFTDNDIKSKGFNGFHTKRNSMSLLNIGFQFTGRMFWDERSDSLEAQVLMPIHDSIEMGLGLDELVLKLNKLPYYHLLFEKAFGTSEITKDRIAKALSQFVRSIITYRSNYDKYLAGHYSLTNDEYLGKRIFEGYLPNGKLINHSETCILCHSTELQLSTNEKLETDPVDINDKGIGEFTGLITDIGRFKSPTLRNVSQSAPYMHNGSISNLDSLLRIHGNLSKLQNGNPTDNIRYMKAFLNTLTDNEIMNDVKFSNPF